MPRAETTLRDVLSGRSDSNIRFNDLTHFRALRFVERISGDHHIFSRHGIPEIINVQPRGSMSKDYQIRQVRGLILRYQIGSELDEQV